MKYIKVQWIHENSEYPVWLYSEVDESFREIRKIEQYADGRLGYASQTRVSGGSELSVEPLPPFEQIAADPEFNLAEISQDEFERVWFVAQK